MKLPFLKLTLAALSIAPHLPAQAAPAAPAAKPADGTVKLEAFTVTGPYFKRLDQ